MHNIAARILLCLLWLSLSACSLWQAKPKDLLTVSSDAQRYVAQQQWRVNDGAQQYLLQVIVERGADHWQWVLMDSLGQRLVTAAAVGGKVTIAQHQSHPLNKRLPELLQAWQFSSWPLLDLQQKSAAAWLFQGDASHRDIWFSGIVRATIDYSAQNPWSGSLHYVDRKNQFDLTIESQLLNTP